METQVSYKEKFIWNMLASTANALATVVLAIAANRLLGTAAGGVFAFAYANAQLMWVIGGFEVRPLQSTDVKERYSLSTYVSMRILSCVAMMLVSLVYIMISGFTKEKALVIFFFCAYKCVECYGDVYGGRFQQKDRIDLFGKTFFIRVTTSVLVCILTMYVTRSLLYASIAIFLTSLLTFYFNDRRYFFVEDRGSVHLSGNAIPALLREALPIFLGNFIMNYISNAPKYAIDKQLGDEMQNVYNILFMPAFVINLFSLFVFRPRLVSMAEDWLSGRKLAFAKQIARMYGVIIAFTAIAEVGTYLLGIPVLELLYHVDLSAYLADLMLVMLAGGISALVVYSYYVVVTMRRQQMILLGYGLGLLCALLLAPYMVAFYALRGAILTYGLCMLVIEAFFLLYILYQLWRGKGGANEE